MRTLTAMTSVLLLGFGIAAAHAGDVKIEQSGKPGGYENNTRGAYKMLKDLFNDMGGEEASGAAMDDPTLMEMLKKYMPKWATEEQRRAVLEDWKKKMHGVPADDETWDEYLGQLGTGTASGSTEFLRAKPGTKVVKRRDANGNSATIIQSE